jgi:hypothetical protein
MFKTLAKSRLAKFRLVQSRRTASGQSEAFTHCNDNLPGLRRPAVVGKRRAPTPALACHWFYRNGRLECRWQAESTSDAPIGDFDEHGAMGRASWPTVGRIARPGAGRMSQGSPWTSERCSHGSSVSAKAIGHSRAGLGPGHAALQHRGPRGDLQNLASTVEA